MFILYIHIIYIYIIIYLCILIYIYILTHRVSLYNFCYFFPAFLKGSEGKCFVVWNSFSELRDLLVLKLAIAKVRVDS